MNVILNMLPDYEPTPRERVVHIYLFCFLGLVIATQVSQYVADRPGRWAVAHPYFWRIIHVFEAWLCIQICYRHWLPLMQERSFCLGYEEEFLNFLWLGLLGLDAALVVLGIFKVVLGGGKRPKVKEL